MGHYYRLHDTDAKRGCFEVDPTEAKRWNQQGWGIFWTVNTFDGPRQTERLIRIEAWAVDMDEGSKVDQWERIKRGLVPSRVIETKRGFQVYWRAKDAKPENWNRIVLDRLVPFYGADPRARDLCRILRVPGFMHMKDPANPFPVREIHSWPVAYTEGQMLAKYPGPKPSKAELDAQAHQEARQELLGAGDDFWDRVWALDCEKGLERLSGSGAVGGERYTFKRNRSGTKNILVDGKGTSCWIDREGRIGSLDKGGPTLYQWLRWFKHSPKECADILKRTFPELEAKR